jgi:outer membrane protein
LKRFLIVVIFAYQFMIRPSANAEEFQHLTLQQAWAMALRNHPQIQSEELRARAAQQDVTIARSNYLPQISGDAVRSFADNGTRIAAGDGINNPLIVDRGSYGLTVSQLITDFGRTASRLEAAKAGAAAEAARSEDTRELVLLEVARVYYNVLSAQALLRVADSAVGVRSDLLDKVSALRDAGLRSNLDVSFARRDANEAQQFQLQAQSAVANAMAALAEALGDSAPRKFLLEEPLTLPLPPPTRFDDLLRAASDQNPELQALKAEAQAAQSAYKAERASNYPTVSAVGYAGETPIREAGTIGANYAAAGITLNVPIFTGGRLTAESQKAELDAEAAQRDLEEKQNEIARDLRISLDDVQTAYTNIAAAKQVFTSAHAALELAQTSYEAGRSSIIELTEAQLEETRAAIGDSNAIYDYLIQRAVLDYKIGDLSPTP